MKTKKQNQTAGLGSRSAHSSSQDKAAAVTETPGAVESVERKDNRLPIDYAKREANRQLPTDKLIA